MKASELAALLVQNPDAEVFMESSETPEFSDWYFKTDRITGIQVTPGGVFINKEFIPYEEEQQIKSPSKKPELDSIVVNISKSILECGYYPISDMRDYGYSSGVQFFNEMINDDSVYGYLDGCHWTLSENEVLDKNMTEEYMLTNDITSITVLTSIDDQWNPTYTEMFYEEAKKYFVEKYEIVKYLGEE